MQPRQGFRFCAFIALAIFATLASPRSTQAQPQHAATQQSATANASNPAHPKIRAITAFINLDWHDYQRQIADTLKLLHRAQTTFESRGYQVQTIRIATQPFPEYSQGNFRFAAIANVPPLTPFFPAAYHTGFGHQFAIALESAPVVAAAFKDAPDLASARQRLTDALATVAFDVEHHAGRVDSESGWTYMGIDLSPAPSPAKDASIGVAIENLTKQHFGMSGTLTAAATITAGGTDVTAT